MFVLSLLVGVLGVTSAFQHNWWDKSWSNTDSDTPDDEKAKFRNLETVYGDSNTIVGGPHFNQIDFRYPDWVVNPRPPCTQEGVFPHPRSDDCTWYYRCTARVGVPIFATFYFQCEPGTMFDDDLDQCVHPHSGSECQGSGPQPPSCSALQSSCRNYQGCREGVQISMYMCGQEICYPGGSVSDYCPRGQLRDMATGLCKDIPQGTCEPVCSAVQSSCGNYEVCGGGSLYMCRLEQCNPAGSTREYCSRGQLLEMNTVKCMDIPRSCPPPQQTNCTAICKQVEVCTPTSYTQNVCEYEQCYRGGQDIGRRRMCTASNQVWDVDQGRCVTRPNENTCSCEYTAKNCREYDLCNPSGVRRLCDCQLCGLDMLYDPNTQQCVDKSILCPTLECVFRDSNCDCLNGKSLCTGCFMRGNFVHVSQFCKDQANAEFYHVEKDSCLYSVFNLRGATSGNCPRTGSLRDSLVEPSLTCSIRNRSILKCWGDNSD